MTDTLLGEREGKAILEAGRLKTYEETLSSPVWLENSSKKEVRYKAHEE